ncbi:MAG: ATP-binding cassette domain-containing protein [Bacteroidetes bacterium]|nr:MAG: ATP-binding cassette domain-containing protein [Bacteroidota bacterium]
MDKKPVVPVVEFREVSLAYGERQVLDRISFRISKGEFVYLVGPTGVGKSTLMRLIYSDLQADSGEIQVGDMQVNGISRKDIPYLRRKLGIVFQDYQLLSDRNVYQNIRFALRATGWRDAASGKQRIQEVLMQTGMVGKAEAMPHQLSGGEQQRISIARALINDPLLIIADEPTGNLDPEAGMRVMDILRRIHQAGASVLMATHEYTLIKEFPARVIELQAGRLRDYAQSQDFLSDYGQRLRM